MNNDELFEVDDPNLPEWSKHPIAVFDLETTGLDFKTSRIVTACAVLLNADGSVEGKNVEWLANPGIPIPIEASNVHGITDEIAQAKGADLGQVVSQIIETLKHYFDAGIPVVAYNAPYDFTILRQHAEDFGIEWPENPGPIIDPLVLDKKLEKYRKGKRRLEVVAEYYGVALDDAHNATADAIAAGHVAQALARKYSKELNMTLDELHAKQALWSNEADESFAQYMKNVNPEFKIVLGWPEKPRG